MKGELILPCEWEKGQSEVTVDTMVHSQLVRL